ncbi:MAG: type I-E CRISPR-associated endonuclease Cas1 [Dehalococcoidia bacterium]|nr:type I-E CRISPR-associated endonuclease Cas1 [Dehalococcoidia bacterium]
MTVLRGRLGLETARVPHADRHGLIWLERGNLYVQDGTLRFLAAESPALSAGDYAIPFQMVSFVLLGPGGTVSHDALRLIALHGTGLAAVGEAGVRCYTAPPLGPDNTRLARFQAQAWANPEERMRIARRLYAWRLGEEAPETDLNTLRGVEGSRMRTAYRRLAARCGLRWYARRYDRSEPEAADDPNRAINHAATAMEAAAAIAVAATGTIPQLGFIHEDPGQSFVLDIADLYRTKVTVPVAFQAAAEAQRDAHVVLERRVRQLMGMTLRRQEVIPDMIDKIKELFDNSSRNVESTPVDGEEAVALRW